MPEVIISDASCLIVLSKIGELDLLEKLYSRIGTTQTIADEFGEVLPSYIDILPVKDLEKLKILELQIDKGEASALAVALENLGCRVILDDQKARKLAAHLHINFTGTIGIIVKAKKQGLITAVRPIIEKIKTTNLEFLRSLKQLRCLRQVNDKPLTFNQ